MPDQRGKVLPNCHFLFPFFFKHCKFPQLITKYHTPNAFGSQLIIPMVNRMPCQAHCAFKHSSEHKEGTDRVD